jgi:hypothetical protein
LRRHSTALVEIDRLIRHGSSPWATFQAGELCSTCTPHVVLLVPQIP